MSLIAHALELLKAEPINRDDLEKELNRLVDGYRFLNRAMESLKQANDQAHVEIDVLRKQVIDAQLSTMELRKKFAGSSEVMRQALTAANEQAQKRMLELEALRAALHEKQE